MKVIPAHPGFPSKGHQWVSFFYYWLIIFYRVSVYYFDWCVVELLKSLIVNSYFFCVWIRAFVNNFDAVLCGWRCSLAILRQLAALFFCQTPSLLSVLARLSLYGIFWRQSLAMLSSLLLSEFCPVLHCLTI